MIAIIDYGMGNLRSVQKAVERVGFASKVTSDPADIDNASKIIFPGVGAFGDAVAEICNRGLIEPLIKNIKEGKYFLGICLGLQLLFEKSEENPGVKGLSIFKGSVDRFTGDLKIPHMGWNQIRKKRDDCPVLKEIPDGAYMYFVHSFYVAPQDRSIAACVTDYGKEFVSMVWKDNVFATQFHLEKSQENGLKILKAFCKL